MIESTLSEERQLSEMTNSVVPSRLLELSPGAKTTFPSPAVVDPTYEAAPANMGWKPMELGHYRVTIAQTLAQREAACRLRFKVFNIELGEGLAASYKTGLDTDQFDLFCDQLIVEDRSSTFRLWAPTGCKPARPRPRTSVITAEQEFDFAPYKHIRTSVLELGRASIDREHRSSEVLDPALARHRAIYPASQPAVPDRLLLGHLAGS